MPDRLTNLPAARAALLGREPELARLRELVLHGDGRLVTLTGVGGTGKTSLALEAARRLRPEFADGAYFVDLARAAPGDVALACCAALRLADRDAPPDDVLFDWLEGRQALVVLDNVEPVADETAALLDRLLDRCPDARCLATSRRRLGVRGERVWTVAPLPVPAAEDDLSTTAGAPAVRLFEERARAVRADFAIDTRNVAAVAAICRRVDGLPLAIELAAAQASVMSPAEILASLARPDAQPDVRSGDAEAARGRTIAAAIAASHELLSPSARVLFRRLGAFAAGWTLEAAAVVGGLGAPSATVADDLAELVDHSLVLRTGEPTPLGFRFLVPVAEFARRALAAAGEADAASLAHGAWAAGIASHRDAGTVYCSPTDVERIATHHDECLAALHAARARGDAALAVGLTIGLQEHWRIRGHLRLAVREIGATLALLGPGLETAQATLLLARADSRRLLGDLGQAAADAAEGVELARLHTPPPIVRMAYAIRGDVEADAGDLVRARADYDTAGADLAPGGDPAAVGAWHANVGRLAMRAGDVDEAAAHLETAVAVLDSVTALWYRGLATTRLGGVVRRRGDAARGRELLRSGFAQLRAYGARTEAIECLEELAGLELQARRPRKAVVLLGASRALREVTGVMGGPGRPALDAMIDEARSVMPSSDFAKWWAIGRAMSLDEAAAFAEAGVVPEADPPGGRRPTRDAAARDTRSLTPREAEVARLIAQGLPNAEIASRLVISTGTVRIHVERILGKLGMTSRVQVATWVVNGGLDQGALDAAPAPEGKPLA